MDTPAETLYWTLRHGQRRQIAEQFGVCNAGDLKIAELPAARLWLKRLSDCGSLGPAIAKAKQLHLDELRRIEETIRLPHSQAWREALENWREHHYRILSLATAGD